MSETGNKGPLIKKKPKPMDRPKPVNINAGSNSGFKFNSEPSSPVIEVDKNPVSKPSNQKEDASTNKKDSTARKTRASVVGKNDSVKSIKVPYDIHVKIGVLGKFMDENKTYAILSELIDYYQKNELTDRQQKQFEFMTDFLNHD
ncbi:hypothetical protein LG275_13920 (plasmid) [Chryseomicrobium palamuruense]